MDNICSEKNCNNQVLAKGLCNKHYLRQNRNKNMNRSMKDKNEIMILDDVSHITTFDKKNNKKNTVIVDTKHIEELQKLKWASTLIRGYYYIYAKIKQKPILLSHYIWGLHGKELEKTKLLAYRNKNTLDNRIENLYLVTKMDLQMTMKISKSNISGYKGVSWSNREKRWIATIRYNHKTHYLGSFSDVEEAAAARKAAEEKMLNPKE